MQYMTSIFRFKMKPKGLIKTRFLLNLVSMIFTINIAP